MKRSGLIFAAIVLILVLVFLLRTKNPPSQNPIPLNAISPWSNKSATVLTSTTATAVTQTPATGPTSSLAPSPASSNSVSPTNAPPVLPPLTVLDHARVVMHNYCSVFGENPIGTNPEITAALMGKNPRQINFVTPDSGLRVNDKGEMVDAWGTPFFFHQLSGKEMEIRSAGEDRKMWTFDDLVTR